MENIKFATQRLIDSVWTLVYKQVSPTEIEIIRFDRENDLGYQKEDEFDRVRMVEDDKRTVIGVHIGPKEFLKTTALTSDPYYKVVNPLYIFSYDGHVE